MFLLSHKNPNISSHSQDPSPTKVLVHPFESLNTNSTLEGSNKSREDLNQDLLYEIIQETNEDTIGTFESPESYEGSGLKNQDG